MSTLYTDPPQSRNEAIIKSTIDGTQYTDPPQSRMEDLLLELKEAIEQGGGGTTVVANPEGEATDDLEKLQVGNDIYGIPKDYEDLDNKPSINSVELDGNKTASELGLQPTLDGAQTISGNPITVTDAEPMNAESVVVELEPKQDLHGYDGPWTGGAGKNLLECLKTSASTLNDITCTPQYDSDNNLIGYSLVGTATANSDFTLHGQYMSTNTFIPSGTYNIKIFGAVNGVELHYGYGGDTYNNTNSDIMNTTECSNGIAWVVLRVKNGTAINTAITVKPMIWDSTLGEISFAPYSNICPITGYSEVNVERVGKNLWDGEFSINNGYLASDGTTYSSDFWKITDYIPVIGGKDYTISYQTSNQGGAYTCWYDENKNFIGSAQFTTASSLTFTLPNNAKYLRSSQKIDATNYQVELGNQPTTYEPYQGNTYTVSLGGTKYGGTLDVTEGVLTVDRVTESITSVNRVVTDKRMAALATLSHNHSTNLTAIICNNAKTENTSENLDVHYISVRCAGGRNNEIWFFFPTDIASTLAEADTWFTNNLTQVCYKLATPLTIQLTPTQIQMLENTNNISTDGTNITLKYQPNNVIGEAKVYTDEKCSEVLPPLPTTDGTYHLSCEVTSGVGVLSWVSDS